MKVTKLQPKPKKVAQRIDDDDDGHKRYNLWALTPQYIGTVTMIRDKRGIPVYKWKGKIFKKLNDIEH